MSKPKPRKLLLLRKRDLLKRRTYCEALREHFEKRKPRAKKDAMML